jgi:hypothetical protein
MPSPRRIGLAISAVAVLMAVVYLGFLRGTGADRTAAPAKGPTSPENPPLGPLSQSTDTLASTGRGANRKTIAAVAATADSTHKSSEAVPSSAIHATSTSSGRAAATDAGAGDEHSGKNDKPRGWSMTGAGVANCTFQSDHGYAQSGVASALLQSSNSSFAQWCATIQASASGRYKGTRLQFSAYLSTQNSAGGAFLWFRADDAQGLTVAFENQRLQPLAGNSPWTFEVIVIDVPETAQAIFYGAVLRAGGLLWMDSAEFNVVDKTVPLTSRPITAQEAVVNPHLNLAALRATPENLDFEESVPRGSD